MSQCLCNRRTPKLVALDTHDPVRRKRIDGESCEQFKYPGQVGAYAVVIELPSRKPGFVADSRAEKLAARAETVDGLRSAQLQ